MLEMRRWGVLQKGQPLLLGLRMHMFWQRLWYHCEIFKWEKPENEHLNRLVKNINCLEDLQSAIGSFVVPLLSCADSQR